MKQYTDRVAKERIRRAMYHEMGHAADNIVENIMIEHGLADPLLSHSSYTAGDPDFTRIFASEAAADQDDYAKIDTDEYFACSFSQYLTGNDPRMEDLQSVTYGYVTGILNIIEQDWNEEAARDENFH
jgi:hypothetical protein